MLVLLRRVSKTCSVVSASLANLELILTLMLFSDDSSAVTVVNTPFSSPNPPPIAPIFSKSVIGFPFSVS